MNNLRDERDITINKKYITWDDVENFISYVADKTNNFKDFNGVYGPARGGVALACMISNRYNLPYLGAPQVGCLIVDDIVDNGDTALTWKNKGYTIAALCYHKNDKVEPEYWTEEKTDEWIVFPWEEDTRKKIDFTYHLDVLYKAIQEAYPVQASEAFRENYNEANQCLKEICGGNKYE